MMKASPAFLTLSTLAFALGLNSSAEAASEVALTFELEPSGTADASISNTAAEHTASSPDKTSVEAAASTEDANAPLPVPSTATNPPVSREITHPQGQYGGGQALAIVDHSEQTSLHLPAPPPKASLTVVVSDAKNVVLASQSSPTSTPAKTPDEAIDTLLLGFDLDEGAAVTSETAQPSSPVIGAAEQVQQAVQAVAHLFEGGTESLVARAVGSAEGTRTPEGHKTPAYFGHTDPGNQVWNLGTFSYQHGARTPEEADTKQLARLQSQTQSLKQKAQARGLQLSTEELLNGIDLANQAPMAALERSGYVDWLAEAHKLNMTGAEAIVWARTRSFLDPDTQQWNAPGLGNNLHSITRDQSRRASAIARAMQAFPLPLQQTSLDHGKSSERPSQPALTTETPPEPIVELMFQLFSNNHSPAAPQLSSTSPDAETALPSLATVHSFPPDAGLSSTPEGKPLHSEQTLHTAQDVEDSSIADRAASELKLKQNDQPQTFVPETDAPLPSGVEILGEEKPDSSTSRPAINPGESVVDTKLAEPTSQVFMPQSASTSSATLTNQEPAGPKELTFFQQSLNEDKRQ